MPLPSFLKPKNTYELKRIGRNNDGGYLIGSSSIKKTKNLVSLGIHDDWSYEGKLIELSANKIKVFCYDDQTSIKFLIKKILNNLIFFFSSLQLKNLLGR